MSDSFDENAGAEPPVPELPEKSQRRLEQIVAGYLTSLLAGTSPDTAALVAAYPDLAPHLGRRLVFVRHVVEQAGRSADEFGQPQTLRPSVTPTSPMPEATPAVPEASAGEAAEPAGDEEDNQPTQTAIGPLGQGESVVHLNCPHCGNPIQIVQVERIEVTCTACGSTICVESRASRRVPIPQPPERFGRFKVLERVGGGGFGLVYRAIDPLLDREVAIKVPRQGYFQTDRDEERFLREARHVAQLRHPHIVQVRDVNRHLDVPFIVSEFIDGPTLEDVIRQRRLPFREAVELIATVAEALDFAHQHGVIHRDIKPSNVLIDKQGQPNITDFGLARFHEAEITITLDGEVLGTPAYMSPEQAGGASEQLDGRSDIYSLGVIFYRLLTGSLPFGGSRRMLLEQVRRDEPKPPRALNEHIPRDLEVMCLKAMAKDPARRYDSARKFAEDLRRWLRNEPILARPVGRAERLARWRRRYPGLAALSLALGLVLLLAALTGLGWGLREHYLKRIAQEGANREADLRALAEGSAQQSDRRLTRIRLTNGLAPLREGDYFTALVWLTRAAESDAAAKEKLDIHRIRIGTLLHQCPRLRQLWTHPHPLTHAVLAADGMRAVAAAADGSVLVWDGSSGRRAAAHFRHSAQATFVALHPQQPRLLVAGPEPAPELDPPFRSHVSLWDLESELRVWDLVHPNFVDMALFSADGQLVVTACRDGLVRIWNADSGALLRELKHPAAVQRMALSPDHRFLLAASNQASGVPGTAHLWSLETGEEVGEPIRHESLIRDVAIASDGKSWASCSDDGTVHVGVVGETKPTRTLYSGGKLLRVLFVPGRQWLVTTNDQGLIYVWDPATGQLRRTLTQTPRPGPLSVTPDGSLLAAGGSDGLTRVWDLESGQLRFPPLPQAGAVNSVAFDASGRLLLTCSQDQTVKVWDLAVGAPRLPPLQHQGAVTRAVHSPDGKRIVTVSADKTARVWDAETGQPLSEPLDHAQELLDCAISPRGDVFATAAADGSVRIWDLHTARLRQPVLAHAEVVYRLVFSPDGLRLATASRDRTAGLWNVSDGTLIARLPHDPQVKWGVQWVLFSPDGKLLVTAGADRTARIWQATDGAPVGEPLSHPRGVLQAEFHPGGKQLVTAGLDHSVRVWDLATWRLLREVRTHRDSVRDVAYVENGKQLLVAGLRGPTEILDAASGETLAEILDHPGVATFGASLSQTRRLFATATSRDPAAAMLGWGSGAAQVWDLRQGDPVTPPWWHRRPVLSTEFAPDGQSLLTAGRDSAAYVWDLSPDPRPLEELIAIAELLAGARIDPVAGFLRLDHTQLQQRWEAYRAKHRDILALGAR